jgi:hypothetical protein
MKRSFSPRYLYPLLIAVCGALAACLVGAGLIPLTVDPESTASRSWRGYYTVLLEGSSDAAAIALDLARRPGVEAVVSRHTARVDFNTFGGFKSATIHEISRRLDPADPRLDPYLSRVSSLFVLRDDGTEWEVLFLRSSLPRWRMIGTIAAMTRGYRWVSPDFDPWSAVLRIVLLLGYTAVLVLRCRSWETAAVLSAGLVPWLTAVLVGSFSTLLLFFMTAPLWTELLIQYRDQLAERGTARPGFSSLARLLWGRLRATSRDYSGLPLVALALTALFLVLRGGTAVLPSLVPVLSGLLLLPLQYVVTVLVPLGRFHPVFRAQPILSGLVRREPWLNRRRILDLALVAIVTASVGTIAVVRRGASPPYYVPLPIHGAGDAISWRALEKLASASSPLEPPTLADYLSHRAYQEGLPFGRRYGLPTAGERITISRYLAGSRGPEIIRTHRVVKRFQATWLQETLAAVEVGSVERLLLDQGFATRVVVRRPSLAPATVLAAIAVGLFLAAWLLGRDFRLTAPRLYVTTSLTLRRNQHPL